jgi:hypothetical protein
MSENDFTKKAKHEELVTLDGEWAIYKVIYGFNAENTSLKANC